MSTNLKIQYMAKDLWTSNCHTHMWANHTADKRLEAHNIMSLSYNIKIFLYLRGPHLSKPNNAPVYKFRQSGKI